jgi:predicted  nucleic acid-binding Zn-ribbon protein
LENKSEPTLQQLENHRKHLADHMKQLREELKEVDSKITNLKKRTKPELQGST